MARTRAARGPRRTGRATGPRGARGRGRSAPGGAGGIVSQITGMMSRGGGRGASRGGGGGMAAKATNFVSGFLSGGGRGTRGRRR
jgi:hypothetical protein